VARLPVDEFGDDPRLQGRELVADLTPVRVRGDLDAVGLALRNLVENALVHGMGGHWIRVSSRREPGGIVLAVTDDGPGVRPDDLPALTQRFKRAGNAAGVGSGLGLAIVAMLARRMHARLGLDSPAQGLATGFEARLTWAAPAKEGS
jgi:two-component system, OmpR family, sensor kinase